MLWKDFEQKYVKYEKVDASRGDCTFEGIYENNID
jgi:hypothetical protein